MIVGIDGAPVQVIRPIHVTEDSIDVLKDIIMVKMRERRIPLSRIGQLFGVDKSTVHRRLVAMNAGTYDAYSRAEIGGLIGDTDD